MEKAMREERRQISLKIWELENGRCSKCKDTPSTQKMVHCDCSAAVEIRRLGEVLIKKVGKRRDEELETALADVATNGLTVDSYHKFKSLNKSDREISKLIGWYYGKLVDFKYDNGLSSKKGPAHIELTDAEVETAKQNGLSMSLVRKRIRLDGWEVARAISESPNSHKKEFARWAEIAKKNGIQRKTFSTRLRNGFSFEEAATRKRGAHKVSQAEKYNLREDMAELAKENGIIFTTFKKRVLELGWTQEDAATKPLQRKKVEVLA